MFSVPRELLCGSLSGKASSRNHLYRPILILLTSASLTFPKTRNATSGGSSGPVGQLSLFDFLDGGGGVLFVHHSLSKVGSEYVSIYSTRHGGYKRSIHRDPRCCLMGALKPGAFHTSCSLPLQLLPLSSCNKDPSDCPFLPRPYQCGSTRDFSSNIYWNEVSCIPL